LVIATGQTDWSRARWRTPLIVTASLALHAAILGPLALNSLGLDLGPRIIEDPDPWFPIDVVLVRPSLSGEPSRGRETRPVDRPLPTTPVAETGRSRDDVRFRAGPVAIAPAQAAPSASPAAPDAPQPVPGSTAGLSDVWTVRPTQPDARIAESLRRSAAGCRTLWDRLDPAERARCDQVFATTAARAGPIQRTADPARDARFAALGNQALADYDRRRAPLKPNSHANPCPEGPDPGDPCAFAIKGRLWSSRDGVLPDLPGRQ